MNVLIKFLNFSAFQAGENRMYSSVLTSTRSALRKGIQARKPLGTFFESREYEKYFSFYCFHYFLESDAEGG